MKTVRDLNRDQLDELKSAYFWDPDTQDILPEEVVYPEQIPDEVIFDYYDGVMFVDDDFSVSAST